MHYFLDTNAAIALIKGAPPAVREKYQRVAPKADSISISSVVAFELWYGVARSARQRENTERLRVFLSGAIAVLPFDEDDATAAGELRATLEKAGTPFGPYDLMIAAQALRADATLVTANTSEFARVRGLALQDWAAKG